MIRWWWVRHGPTHATGFLGHTDRPADLSDTAALARLDAHLPRGAALVSSDLARARMTADALARGRRRLADAPGLREFDFGAWEGLSFDAISARDPELSRAFWDEPGTPAPPGGESWAALAARVGAAAARIAAEAGSGDIVAVAHLGPILTRIAAADGRGARAALSFHAAPLSVTRIDEGPDGARLLVADHRP